MLLLGNEGVGKTSIRRRYLGQGFDHAYQTTVGVDFAVRHLLTDTHQYIIQVWDVAGQDAYAKFRAQYYRGAHGVLLVIDVSKLQTLESLDKWLQEMIRNLGKYLPMMLIGNKSDLREGGEHCIDPGLIEIYLDSMREKIGFDIQYVETSALANINIELAFSNLLQTLDAEKLQ
jgi:small GTP-binding protein